MSGILATHALSEHIAEVTAVPTSRRQYADEELVALFRRCFGYAMRKLKREEDAQDFGSWALIAVLEGRPPKVDWLWVDWTRESIGRAGTETGRLKYSERTAHSLDAPVSDENDTPLHEVIAAPDYSDPDRERTIQIAHAAYWDVDHKTRDIVDLWRAGKTQTEIGVIYGVTGGRVCQRLHVYRLALARAAVRELRARAPESVDVDTRLEVQWLQIP